MDVEAASSGPFDLEDLEGVDLFVEGVEFGPQLHWFGLF